MLSLDAIRTANGVPGGWKHRPIVVVDGKNFHVNPDKSLTLVIAFSKLDGKIAAEELMYCQHEGRLSWFENDARGIPLCKVCEKCRSAKLAVYKRDVLENPNYQVDEPIEDDSWF